MSYEVLTTIVVINVIATIALWRSLSRSRTPDRPKLNKKAANALWRSKPIVPRHDPPKVAGGDLSEMADADDRLFFSDFKEFADVVNADLSNEYTPSAFRLQDLSETDVGTAESGPMLGRCFALYYNQSSVGRLEISPAYKYGSDSQMVYTSFKIDWARFIGFEELTDFFSTIADYVTNHDPKSGERAAAWQSINRALTQTLWENYRISYYDKPDDQDWGDLALRLQGSAAWYIERRRNWHEQAVKNSASATRAAPAKPPSDAAPAKKRAAKAYLKETAIIAGVLLVLLLVGLLFSQR